MESLLNGRNGLQIEGVQLPSPWEGDKEPKRERSRTDSTKKLGEFENCWDECLQRCEEKLEFRFSGNLGKCKVRILPQE